MFFIGDIHGKYPEYEDWLEVFGNRPSIQLGDFGFGFRELPNKWPLQHKFIRGNHDDPAKCRKHQNYLGDYGITEDGIFYVGGGYSIDWEYRQRRMMTDTRRVWWPDEEIAEEEFETILALYSKYKPKVVVSHDCPCEVRELIPSIKNEKQFRNRTSDGLLSAMFQQHQPDLWVFGHYHEPIDMELEGVKFKCLAELEVFEYEIQK